MDIQELKERWIHILRMKAAEYEYTARKNNQIVSEPDLDTICNEMEAFFIGLEN